MKNKGYINNVLDTSVHVVYNNMLHIDEDNQDNQV